MHVAESRQVVDTKEPTHLYSMDSSQETDVTLVADSDDVNIGSCANDVIFTWNAGDVLYAASPGWKLCTKDDVECNTEVKPMSKIFMYTTTLIWVLAFRRNSSGFLGNLEQAY